MIIKKNFFLNKAFFIIIFLIFFSIIFNQYYGNRGVFPHDSFSHFETGYRILIGDHPFKDYWVISGAFIDYLQALFFYLFGINWQAYVLHASTLNAIVTLYTFFLLRSFNLNIFYSFFYSLFFSVLAYPSSGTPFVDHHSTFFSLLGVYSFIFAIKSEKSLHWILFTVLFFFAFLSKQVPSSYILLLILPVIVYLCFIKKNYNPIKVIFLSGLLLTTFIIFFGYINEISISSFLDQYIFYPPSIGENRIENLKISLPGFLNHFKFILIALIPLVYINLKNIFSNKKYLKSNNFIYFLIIIFLTASLIFHQILTRNQTFIFFLVPLLFAFSQIYLGKIKSWVIYFLILFCLGITTKYHLRFNEGRKFHELIDVDFNLAVKASLIDKKLRGLKWITPGSNNPNKEVIFINSLKNILEKDGRNIMVLSNYQFLSVILERDFSSTTRWHIFDGTDYPQIGNKYYYSYQNLFKEILKRKKIEVIYTILPVKNSNIYDYISNECFKEKKINQNIISYQIQSCKDLNFP